MARDLINIAVFGALGALARHGLGLWIQGRAGTLLPVGTLFVNVLGSLILGFIAGTALGAQPIPPAWRLALGTGFLGAFTTFSTFSVETVRLMAQGEWATVMLNLGLQLGLGLGAAAAGLALASYLGRP